MSLAVACEPPPPKSNRPPLPTVMLWLESLRIWAKLPVPEPPPSNPPWSEIALALMIWLPPL